MDKNLDIGIDTLYVYKKMLDNLWRRDKVNRRAFLRIRFAFYLALRNEKLCIFVIHTVCQFRSKLKYYKISNLLRNFNLFSSRISFCTHTHSWI